MTGRIGDNRMTMLRQHRIWWWPGQRSTIPKRPAELLRWLHNIHDGEESTP